MRRFTIFILCAAACLFGRAQINTDRMMDVGRNALYFDDYALSIQYFNQVVQAKPYLYEPYFYRGLAKFYLEDYLGTEEDLTRAMEINPFIANTYELRGLARINLKKYGEASADYARATDMEPERRNLWHNWVLCNLEMDSIGRADSISRAMVARWPRHGDGYVLRSQVLLAQKDTAGAEQMVDSALAHDRYNIPSLSLKGNMLMRREAWAEADSAFSEAIRLQPKNTHNLINRALARYHLHNLRGAMADYDLALQVDPQNFVGHYNRGLLRAQVGEDNLAIEDFDFILRIDPGDVMALYNRAELLFETGDYRGAIRDYTALIKVYPQFWQGYMRRAQARRMVGDTRGAASDEDHVLREQIAHRFGYQTKTSRKGVATRKKSEVNLEEYQKLVVEDEEEQPAYASEYRGKIQNKESDMTLQPPVSLSDYQKEAGGRSEAFDTALEHLLLKEYEAAILDFGKAIEARGSGTAEAYYNRAYALAQKQQYGKAIDDLTEAIRLNGNFAQAYFNRGVLQVLLGNKQAAMPDLSKAGELGIFAAYSILKHSK